MGCRAKTVDPLDRIKALIPEVETRLNRRDLAGLKRMGTERFESNAFVIDIFADRARDSVALALSRIHQDGADATLFLQMTSRQTGARQELRLHLRGNGRWKIDGYEVVAPGADTIGTNPPS
ncbi:MAG TPA: hypothetical protein VNN55_00115 [bacterium]|nr:hypothetical protein [bacterium]